MDAPVQWSECIAPKFICWNHNAQCVTVLEGGDFERCLGYESRALMNGISAL